MEDCRLDQVLMTFASLYHFFDSLTDIQDQPIRTAVCRSLETRWEKAEQDVFVAAVILNPWLRTASFRPLVHLFAPAAIHALFVRLWKRFWPTEVPVPALLYAELNNYLKDIEPEQDHSPTNLSGMQLTMAAVKQLADEV